MVETARMLLGYAILFVLFFFIAYGIFKTVFVQHPLLGLVLVIAILSSLVMEVVTNNNCTCLSDTIIFSTLTKWYFENILGNADVFVRLIFLLLFIIFLFDRYGFEMRLFSGTFNFLIGYGHYIILGIIASYAIHIILSYIVCPLMCGHSINLNNGGGGF